MGFKNDKFTTERDLNLWPLDCPRVLSHDSSKRQLVYTGCPYSKLYQSKFHSYNFLSTYENWFVFISSPFFFSWSMYPCLLSVPPYPLLAWSMYLENPIHWIPFLNMYKLCTVQFRNKVFFFSFVSWIRDLAFWVTIKALLVFFNTISDRRCWYVWLWFVVR